MTDVPGPTGNAGRSTVHAAGTVLWRPTGGRAGVEVAVVHRARHEDWSLPKGKHEPGETPSACAVRETEEETGFRPVLGRPLGRTGYRLPGEHADKVVRYFAGRAPEGAFVANDEVDELRWLRPHTAAKRLTYHGDREVLARFTALPANTRTVLLVRHAKAGNRSQWPGDDALRPLSPAGKLQAAGLRAMLPLFGPVAVHAASRVRCVQTVTGVADVLGVDIAREPQLTEQGYQADPAAAVRRLLALLSGPTPVVVCGQGGAIPGMIARLAARADLGFDDIPSKKGSIWVLSFTATGSPRLLAADYLPTSLPAPVPGQET